MDMHGQLDTLSVCGVAVAVVPQHTGWCVRQPSFLNYKFAEAKTHSPTTALHRIRIHWWSSSKNIRYYYCSRVSGSSTIINLSFGFICGMKSTLHRLNFLTWNYHFPILADCRQTITPVDPAAAAVAPGRRATFRVALLCECFNNWNFPLNYSWWEWYNYNSYRTYVNQYTRSLAHTHIHTEASWRWQPRCKHKGLSRGGTGAERDAMKYLHKIYDNSSPAMQCWLERDRKRVAFHWFPDRTRLVL